MLTLKPRNRELEELESFKEFFLNHDVFILQKPADIDGRDFSRKIIEILGQEEWDRIIFKTK